MGEAYIASRSGHSHCAGSASVTRGLVRQFLLFSPRQPAQRRQRQESTDTIRRLAPLSEQEERECPFRSRGRKQFAVGIVDESKMDEELKVLRRFVAQNPLNAYNRRSAIRQGGGRIVGTDSLREAVSMFQPERQRLTFAFAGCVMLVCNLLVANMSGQTASPAVAGDYAGVLGPLHLVLHLQRDTAGKLSGSLDSLDQGALGIPCADFVLSGAQFSFNVPAVSGAYSGTVSADGKTITGTWDQGKPMPLVLTQTAAQTKAEPAFVAAVKPSPVDGDWKGALDTPGGQLPTVIHVKSDRSGKEYVAFDSLSQNAFGLTGDNATLKGDQFSFDLPIVHGHYEGKLSADGKTITGTWNQGKPLPLNFTRFVAAERPSLADGDWAGVLQTKYGALHAAIHVTSDKGGKEYLSLDSPDQDVKNLEGADAVLIGRSFSFKVPQLQGEYVGTVTEDGNAIEGTWRQQGSSIPLRFKKTPNDTPVPIAPTTAQAAPLTLPELKAKLDAELKPLVENPALAGASGIGVAIGVFERGEQRVLTYGVAKEDSLFEIGSITKTFTGLILSEMVVEKKVSLDTPVRELLPPETVAKSAGPEITLLSLATHHSGMARMPDNFHPADPANPYADYTEKDLYQYIAKTGLALTPDAKFKYSNLGMGLLGDALAHKAGEKYSDLLKQDVLEPLHMEHTFIVLPPAEQGNFLPPHDGMDKPIHSWDSDAMAPAGGIRSDVRDMLKYMAAQLHPPTGTVAQAVELEHELRADMDGAKIAINWMFDPRDANYDHGGGTGGFTSYAFFNTKDDVAGVVLVNRSSGLAESLGSQIAELLEGLPVHPIRR
jgi:D-alanyl-D-alanine-carboxypeptidase/D-alanyl-D-alanine-endopeptidase